MKYYNGMGKNVTDYVVNLENKVIELEKRLSNYEKPSIEQETMGPKTTIVGTASPQSGDVVIFEEEKLKPKKVRKVADTK